MSRRPGYILRVDHPADGGVSPNQYMPYITVETRVHYPPKATLDQVEKALTQAWANAMHEAQERIEDATG